MALPRLDIDVALFRIACCRFAPFAELPFGRLRRFHACGLRLGRKATALISSSLRQFLPAGHQGGFDLRLERVECSIEGVVDVIVERRHGSAIIRRSLKV